MPKRVSERKRREEQEATAHAFQEFIRTFQDISEPPNKTFLKSGILNAKPGEEIESLGEIYNPQPIFKSSSSATIKNAIECARLLKEPRLERTKRQEKRKTNLEILKEELKLRHLGREEKNKVTEDLAFVSGCVDSKTTNLFIAHICAYITEQHLMQLFGAYGPLASVKIMWPRHDERNRSRCGFVAFMSRKDAERAMHDLKDCADMNVDWGKPIELPPNPIFIPPELLKQSLPPPSTGLPFNSQPLNPQWKTPETEEGMQELLYNSVVKVIIPFNKKQLMTINRTIEFVIREGPSFEAMIMNREIFNPTYQFLFDNRKPEHIYYRWKLYSMLHGETYKSWTTKPFRMFKNGSLWNPPVIPDYTKGMPENLINTSTKIDRKLLSDAQTNRLVQLIQVLTLTKTKIGEAMVFCLNHVDAVKDIVDIITNSFMNEATEAPKKVARLNLLSDILYNSSMKKCYAPLFCTELEKHLGDIFKQLQITYKNLQMTVDKQAFKRRILNVLRSWDLWKIYSSEQLHKLENVFLNISLVTDDYESETEPLDGANLIKRPLKNVAECRVVVHPKEENSVLAGFIPSKWEVVDPDEVEAQAMSTKKFYDLEMARQLAEKTMQKQLTEEERETLRKVELMVMHYEDDIEAGKIKLKNGITMEKELHNFRSHLLEGMKNEKGKKSVVKSDGSSDSDDKENLSVKRKDYKRQMKKKRNAQKHNKRSWK